MLEQSDLKERTKVTTVVNFITFYPPVFLSKANWAAFLKLQFGFVTFWQKDIGKKARLKC